MVFLMTILVALPLSAQSAEKPNPVVKEPTITIPTSTDVYLSALIENGIVDGVTGDWYNDYTISTNSTEAVFVSDYSYFSFRYPTKAKITYTHNKFEDVSFSVDVIAKRGVSEYVYDNYGATVYLNETKEIIIDDSSLIPLSEYTLQSGQYEGYPDNIFTFETKGNTLFLTGLSEGRAFLNYKHKFGYSSHYIEVAKRPTREDIKILKDSIIVPTACSLSVLSLVEQGVISGIPASDSQNFEVSTSTSGNFGYGDGSICAFSPVSTLLTYTHKKDKDLWFSVYVSFRTDLASYVGDNLGTLYVGKSKELPVSDDSVIPVKEYTFDKWNDPAYPNADFDYKVEGNTITFTGVSVGKANMNFQHPFGTHYVEITIAEPPTKEDVKVDETTTLRFKLNSNYYLSELIADSIISGKTEEELRRDFNFKSSDPEVLEINNLYSTYFRGQKTGCANLVITHKELHEISYTIPVSVVTYSILPNYPKLNLKESVKMALVCSDGSKDSSFTWNLDGDGLDYIQFEQESATISYVTPAYISKSVTLYAYDSHDRRLAINSVHLEECKPTVVWNNQYPNLKEGESMKLYIRAANQGEAVPEHSFELADPTLAKFLQVETDGNVTALQAYRNRIEVNVVDNNGNILNTASVYITENLIHNSAPARNKIVTFTGAYLHVGRIYEKYFKLPSNYGDDCDITIDDTSIIERSSAWFINVLKDGTTLMTLTPRDSSWGEPVNVEVEVKASQFLVEFANREKEFDRPTRNYGYRFKVGVPTDVAIESNGDIDPEKWTIEPSYSTPNSLFDFKRLPGNILRITALTSGSGDYRINTNYLYPFESALVVLIGYEEVVKPESIDDNMQMSIDDRMDFSASITAEPGEIVTWTSSDESVATVDQTGKVTPRNVGTTEIKATKSNSVSRAGDETVTITLTVYNIEIQGVPAAMEIGQTATGAFEVTPVSFPDLKVKWSSSNEEVLSIDEQGNLLAKAPGVALVTLESPVGNRQVSVTVKSDNSDLPELTLDPPTYKGTAGDTFTITPSTPVLGWTSSDNSVATVNHRGHVTLMAEGSAVITAVNEKGKTATCTVIVGPSGIFTGIGSLEPDGDGFYPVYDLSGRMVARTSEQKAALPSGIYIQGGRKIYIRR